MDDAPRAPSDLRLSRAETLGLAGLYALLVAVAVGGFAVAFALGASWAFFPSLGAISFVFGLRHGVDADHIAAIDNTTRKLLHDGGRPLTVGTWFSLGHSTIVVALIVVLVVATEFIRSHIAAFQSIGELLGTAISGGFLFLIGLLNVVIVVEVYRLFQGVRDGRIDEEALERQLSQRGFLSRYFGRLFRLISRPWQVYPVGVLFGLGFDTASEIALIALSVGVGASGRVPLLAVLVLPLLFLSGMVLVDTTDGVAMRYAYGWAFSHPIRKIYYNLALTVISVIVAFAIGGAEILNVVSLELGLGGPFWDPLAHLNFEYLGYAVIGLFLVSWLIALAIYRAKHYESRPPQNRPPSPGESSPEGEAPAWGAEGP